MTEPFRPRSSPFSAFSAFLRRVADWIDGRAENARPASETPEASAASSAPHPRELRTHKTRLRGDLIGDPASPVKGLLDKDDDHRFEFGLLGAIRDHDIDAARRILAARPQMADSLLRRSFSDVTGLSSALGAILFAFTDRPSPEASAPMEAFASELFALGARAGSPATDQRGSSESTSGFTFAALAVSRATSETFFDPGPGYSARLIAAAVSETAVFSRDNAEAFLAALADTHQSGGVWPPVRRHLSDLCEAALARALAQEIYEASGSADAPSPAKAPPPRI